ncbi:hypothetical protein CEUSTIGMA_g7076.t1 [Chlamydomonas eustigma]|uniref:Carboxypeptidase n=1 Tax=Chlamydomonas eustigma TaxID=1157962 RepID=A0A250X970_9CHLO|nr:hypothetical protein CEUSTIGMA_g7076.t1 [Chlamydomonas eustigma]|eukprot:GAX79635.1 hypothetical protein CEUSTIGMA_g7076.t1 [Chlamydomonas eustigma]
MHRAFEELGPINIYEIYADICIPTSAAAQLRQMASVLGDNHPAGLAARIATRHNSAAWATGDLYASQDRRSLAQGMAKDPSSYDSCVGGEVEVYMNLPEVQKALHANQTVVLPWPWKDCVGHSVLHYSRGDVLSSMLPVYKQLVETGILRILVFSGDVDRIVPVVGTRRWVSGLGLPIAKPWRPWLSTTGQVAGHVVNYVGLTLATVRNAGHMVPYVQPERMFKLLSAFLQDEEL